MQFVTESPGTSLLIPLNSAALSEEALLWSLLAFFFFFLCSFIELQLQSPLLAHVKCCIIFLKCTLKNCTSLSKPQSCLYSASGECFLIFFSFFGPGLYIFFSVPCQILNIIAHMFCFKMSLGQKPALVFWLPVLDSSYHLFFDLQVLIFLSTPWCILKCF